MSKVPAFVNIAAVSGPLGPTLFALDFDGRVWEKPATQNWMLVHIYTAGEVTHAEGDSE